MQKTIKTDNFELTLRSSGATPIFYNGEFHTDFFGDAVKVSKMAEIMSDENGKQVELSTLSDEEINKIDMTIIYKILWAFARGANKNIDGLEDWLDQFDDFPISEIMPVVSELLGATFKTTKKSKLNNSLTN